jgi:hypothetical protein
MAKRRTLQLSEQQRTQLLYEVRHGHNPQLQERCAALLKIADGASPHAVATKGLLRPRDPDTLYHWLNLYQKDGLAALQQLRLGGPRRRGL